MTEDRKRILGFLAQQPVAVLSTIDSKTGKPEAALIAFAETEELEIIFGTMQYARKYENLKKNPTIALVAGIDAVRHITLQYEGVAHEAIEAQVEEYKKIMLHKDTPCTEEFLSNKDFKMFKITPTWIALSDYTQKPVRVIELKF